MGAAQSIPIVGETVTAIDSGMKLLVSGTCAIGGEITGDEDVKNTAWKFFKDAGKTWVEYSERNIIVAPVRASVHAINGDKEEAGRVLGKMGRSVEQVMDNTPVIGHAKGVVHYIAGDTEHGNNCMKGSTRSVAVLGAGALSGGVGLGAVVGGMSGMLGGVAYDGAVTVIDSKAKGEKCPYGVHQSVDKAVKSLKGRDSYAYFGSLLDVGYAMGGDFLAGAAAAETVELVEAENQRSALKNKVGKEAAKDLVDAAKELEVLTEDIDGDNHVCTKAKNLDTIEAEFGVNKRCRQWLRENEFLEKGEASGYKSITNARKGHAGKFPRAPGVLEKAAKEQNIEINPISKRSPQACAEHHAFNELGAHGGVSNVSVSSVMKTEGYFMAVERCGNCIQYGSLMGDAISDLIHGMPVPVKEFSFVSVATCAGAAVVVSTGCGAEHFLEEENSQ